MPQPKRYASVADRQAAYRTRCEHARQRQASDKGLPALPSLASMPGWPRWNATFRMAHDLIEGAASEMQDHYEDRSVTWQERERGDEHQERITSVESVLEALGDLIS